MILNLGSLSFNANIDGGGGTPAWGTELGQGDGYKFQFEDMSDFFTGIVYSSVKDIKSVTCPLGKGGKQQAEYDFVVASHFSKIYSNGVPIPDAEFVLLIVKKIAGEHHVGRRSIKYNPKMTFNQKEINAECYTKISEVLRYGEHAAWFVYEINIKNQDELHFTTFMLDSETQYYRDSKTRKEAYLQKLSSENIRVKVDVQTIPIEMNLSLQTIYYGTPGSGKSRKVRDILKEAYPEKDELEEFTFRTTFHPDSDYSTFVGCYKPTMKEVGGVHFTTSIASEDKQTTMSLAAEPQEKYSSTKEEITYKFVQQTFTKAYEKAWVEWEKGENDVNKAKKVYLVIEEINRGNCAQIFGDLFQLLDRNAEGFSDYPIEADADLANYLIINNGVSNSMIKNGILCFPPNLYILATMNTSDQSLFPMDSAFKRRWNWEYVPIDYKNTDSGKFKILIGDIKYDWHAFLKAVNKQIKDVTKSEDKQLGNFFVKGDANDVISEKTFINKVMFYIWNDVVREEYGTKRNFFQNVDANNKEFSFNDLFTPDAQKLIQGFMKYIQCDEVKE